MITSCLSFGAEATKAPGTAETHQEEGATGDGGGGLGRRRPQGWGRGGRLAEAAGAGGAPCRGIKANTQNSSGPATGPLHGRSPLLLWPAQGHLTLSLASHNSLEARCSGAGLGPRVQLLPGGGCTRDMGAAGRDAGEDGGQGGGCEQDPTPRPEGCSASFLSPAPQ